MKPLLRVHKRVESLIGIDVLWNDEITARHLLNLIGLPDYDIAFLQTCLTCPASRVQVKVVGYRWMDGAPVIEVVRKKHKAPILP